MTRGPKVNEWAKALARKAHELEQRSAQLEQRSAQLERAEEINRAVLQSFGEPLVMHDANWRFQYINDAAMEMFRTSKHHLPASLIGQSLWALYPDIIDTDFGIHLRRAMTERTPVSFEAYYPERGEWSDLRCYPVPDGGIITVWKTSPRAARPKRPSAISPRPAPYSAAL